MPAKKTASRKRKVAKSSRKKATKSRPSARKKTTGKKRKVTKRKVSAKKTSRKKAVARKKPTAKKSAKKKKVAKRKAIARKSAAKRRASKKRAAKKSARKKKVTKKKPAAKKKVAKKKPAAKKKAARKTPSRKKQVAKRLLRPKKTTARRRDILSGPIHGIEPYVIRRGEEYMSPGQLQHFEAILDSWKCELMVEVDRTVHHMQDEAANFPDPNDRATQESEFGLELRTRDRERKLLRKINSALIRIEEGSYGYCDETGEEIGLKRLEARPVATLCVEAQERREMAERQFRDRDDRYR